MPPSVHEKPPPRISPFTQLIQAAGHALGLSPAEPDEQTTYKLVVKNEVTAGLKHIERVGQKRKEKSDDYDPDMDEETFPF